MSSMQNAKSNIISKCTTNELKIMGDFWTLAIIQVLFEGEKRFCQLEKELKSISPTTLSQRLKKLEEQKIIKRKEETLDKISVVYSLTDKGNAVMPILKQIKIFSQKYL